MIAEMTAVFYIYVAVAITSIRLEFEFEPCGAEQEVLAHEFPLVDFDGSKYFTPFII